MEQRSQVLIAAGGCVAVALAIVMLVRTNSATGPLPVVQTLDPDSESSPSGAVATFKLDTAEVGVRADARSVPHEAPAGETHVGEKGPVADSLTKGDPALVDMVNRARALEGLLKDQDLSMHELATLRESVEKALEAVKKQQETEGSPR